jgi:ABC-2 type transport system permease protein
MKNASRPPFPLALLRFWFVRLLPVWCGIALVIFLMQISVCGIVHDNQNVRAFLKFLDLIPSIIKTALGGEGLQMGNTPGLIAIGYQHPLVLVLYMLFAVGVPTGFLAGEVQAGTMELILSRPATKTQVYICAGVLTLAGMFALVIVMFLGTVVATNMYDFGETIPLHLFFRVAVNGGLLASAVGAIALMAAAGFRERNMAVGVTVAFLVVNYFVEVISAWWPRMNFLQPTTLFYYANDVEIFTRSLWPLADMGVLVTILVIATIAGGIIWHRRDLPI